MAAFCTVEIKSGYKFFIIADILEVFYDSFYARNGKLYGMPLFVFGKQRLSIFDCASARSFSPYCGLKFMFTACFTLGEYLYKFARK